MPPLNPKQAKKLAIAGAIVAAIFGLWWWFHDPFRSVQGFVLSDQTIYYHSADPYFSTARRQRTLFLHGISMQSLLTKARAKYPEGKGWTYEVDQMPGRFTATKSSPGDQWPETVVAADQSDGQLKLDEIRVMSGFEFQMVKHAEGSDVFLTFPGTGPRPHPPAGGNLDSSRFLTAG